MYKEAAGLVAIDGPREQIASLLMDSHKKLRVVSIVGFGGLGKTTLAKQVYDGIGGQFSCKAFVSVSQRPDLKSLLSSLKSKIGMEDSSHAHELQDIIDRLREHLKDKRYFIVVDDLWDQPAWNIISCAFPENAYDCEDMERLHSSQYKVRRLSLKSGPGAEGGISETLATSLSQIRSYARFGDSKYTLPLSEFKYLRVLILEFLFDWDTTVDLTAVGNFFLLRYLSVFTLGNYGVALPTKIEGLALLETLDLSSVLTQSLPSDITRLAKLVHLELPDGTMLPEGIHNMKSVRTLRCTGILKGSLEEIKGLGELTNLKHLTLQTADDQFLTVEEVDALVSSIGMLHGLKDLSLDCSSDCDKYESKLDSLPDLPSHLESLELHSWTFSRVPKLIGGLHRLQIISLSVLHLSSDDVRLLGELPSIIDATLDVSDISQGVVVISTGLFPVLEEVYFRANEDVSAYLSFEAGAMPKLKELTLGFGWEGWRGDTPVGMEHLPCLQTIRVILRDTQTESSKNREGVLDDIESAFESAARVHPRHPSVRTEYRC
ncbi:hypothetical protein ZWY2020_025873 [Hordeum vulgare]|nr:hypothetical protein ZWY2020_025873 [Hordeum vulgare]